MRLAADVVKDPEISKLAKDYAQRVFSDEWYYHPAGYFADQGCLDAGYQGMSLYWGTWLALAAPDWPFVGDAVKKSWRLRGYLLLPDPDGTLVGPAHFNARTSSDVLKDQWDWPFRYVAGAFLTDDAACQARFPSEEQLKNGAAAAVGELGAQIAENPGGQKSENLKSSPWRWSLWPDAPAFPMNNFAYDYYPKGYYAHRKELEQKNSPLLKYPFQRIGEFTESFGKVFLIAKRPTFGAIIHSGPVSEFQGEGHTEFAGPFGFGGGSLSAFWTPATGSVLLGRRGGMPFPNQTPPNFDTLETWRQWPIHAVIGQTPAPKVPPGQPPVPGKVFTSARIQNPNPVYEVTGSIATVKVGGTIPATTIGTDKALTGKLEYARTFALDDRGLRVETSVKGDGADQIAELYEVLPVFLREAGSQPAKATTEIQFQVAGQWTTPTEKFTENVQTVRLERFAGTVEIRFDRPRRVKLSPADWADKYLTRAMCRNVLVDLLESGDKAAPIKDAKTVRYQLQAVKK